MIVVRIHGRGGQGSVTAAELPDYAAHVDGEYAQRHFHHLVLRGWELLYRCL